MFILSLIKIFISFCFLYQSFYSSSFYSCLYKYSCSSFSYIHSRKTNSSVISSSSVLVLLMSRITRLVNASSNSKSMIPLRSTINWDLFERITKTIFFSGFY